MMSNKPDHFPYVAHPDMSGRTIEAPSMTLLRQAPMTADAYMQSAVDCIDSKFGDGYAAAHPELVGAFIQASATDLGAAVIARAIETLAKTMEGRGCDVIDDSIPFSQSQS